MPLLGFSEGCPMGVLFAATRKTQPYARKIAHKGLSVEPELLAEIEYRAKSGEERCGTHSFEDCETIYEQSTVRLRPRRGYRVYGDFVLRRERDRRHDLPVDEFVTIRLK
jgi:hypothetical protein